jgi:hypothetical protein
MDPFTVQCQPFQLPQNYNTTFAVKKKYGSLDNKFVIGCDALTEGTKDGRFSKVTNYTLVPLWQSAIASLEIPSFVILPYELAKRFLLS